MILVCLSENGDTDLFGTAPKDDSARWASTAFRLSAELRLDLIMTCLASSCAARIERNVTLSQPRFEAKEVTFVLLKCACEALLRFTSVLCALDLGLWFPRFRRLPCISLPLLTNRRLLLLTLLPPLLKISLLRPPPLHLRLDPHRRLSCT